jgi:hypothetical protein
MSIPTASSRFGHDGVAHDRRKEAASQLSSAYGALAHSGARLDSEAVRKEAENIKIGVHAQRTKQIEWTTSLTGHCSPLFTT